MAEAEITNHAAFIWAIADLLRGDYKQSEYGKVILPLTVLRRLDCVLNGTKAAVLSRAAKLKGRVENVEPVLCTVAGQRFYNASPLDFGRLLGDPAQVAGNLRAYIAGFSAGAREVLDKFDFDAQISRLARSDLLYLVLSRFAEIDLHPDTVSNLEMGYLYEELIRRFSELSNETAGEHFTPREVIRLMVNLLFATEDEVLTDPGAIKTLYDPACGTGGMLSVAEDHLRALNPSARLEVFGQELNDETYAVCRSDMMLKGQDASHIVAGNSFNEDGHAGGSFDYMLANPPFGVEWKKVEEGIRAEHETRGFAGRFGAGLPRINDGSFLFLQHMISKMKAPSDGGSRIAIVFNGSPLFTGSAGSGESEIRRWIIENDWLEGIVALPDQLFYNTEIATYFWVIANRKTPERRGKIQFVDARRFFVKMRKGIGDKRKEISTSQIADVTRLYSDFTEGSCVRIFDNTAFGYQRISVERPLRLRWEIDDETIARVARAKPLAKLPEASRVQLLDALGVHSGFSESDRSLAAGTVDPVLTPLRLTPSQTKAVWNALGVPDINAPVATDKQGRTAPDPDRRDSETVPFPAVPVSYETDTTERLASAAYRRAVDDYLRTEVLPYPFDGEGADLWVDHTKTKVGYQLPLTRYFYSYVPPRPVAEIDRNLATVDADLRERLTEQLRDPAI